MCGLLLHAIVIKVKEIFVFACIVKIKPGYGEQTANRACPFSDLASHHLWEAHYSNSETSSNHPGYHTPTCYYQHSDTTATDTTKDHHR